MDITEIYQLCANSILQRDANMKVQLRVCPLPPGRESIKVSATKYQNPGYYSAFLQHLCNHYLLPVQLSQISSDQSHEICLRPLALLFLRCKRGTLVFPSQGCWKDDTANAWEVVRGCGCIWCTL